ncbi:phage tail fiber C-terminal domain-containing protein, partial [Escherichia coli]
GLFQHLQVRFGDGPWQDVKGLDEVGRFFVLKWPPVAVEKLQ